MAPAVAGLAFLLGVLAGALFGSAGSFRFWQAWAFLAMFGGASLLVTIDLAAHDPALLARRVKGGPASEKEVAQRFIQAAASLAFLALAVLPGLAFRFGWPMAGTVTVVAGHAMLVLGFLVVWRVFRANTYTAATIEVEAGQSVISTGPYRHVRHPMYSGGLLVVYGMPLSLAYYPALAGSMVLTAVIVVRLLHEERYLRRRLPGYAEYLATHPYRLVPRIW